MLKDIISFSYLGSINNNYEGSTNITNNINCAQRSFGLLRRVWKASHISRKTKIKLFNSDVKSTLLYEGETWNAAPRDISTLKDFLNRCMRRNLKIFWPSVITNNDLWTATNQVPLRTEILKRKWNWLSYTLCKPPSYITRTATERKPQDSRRRGRPTHTWRRQLESEDDVTGKSWNEIKLIACNRLVPCSNLERQEWMYTISFSITLIFKVTTCGTTKSRHVHTSSNTV